MALVLAVHSFSSMSMCAREGWMALMLTREIIEAQNRSRAWLFDDAAPLWSTVGVLDDGMFAEKIHLDGRAAVELPRRLRVQARQIYSFCAIGQLGWSGPWREIVSRALDNVLHNGRREDGLFVHLFDPSGIVSDTSLDLYDHAFGLFALAHAGTALGRPDALLAANQIFAEMSKSWERPEGGYWEGVKTPCPPYRQNPHMHMFEATRANYAASGDPLWRDAADRLRGLFERHFRDPASGAVTEFFAVDWSRLADETGAIVEPGHCLEWAWLFDENYDDDGAKAIADGLISFARRYGICDRRGVAINEVMLDGSIKDADARLWPQTERLKAAVARYKRTREPAEADEIVSAYLGLELYFDTATRGLWYDRMKIDGSFIEEAAPASSFYHIVCSIVELLSLK